MLTSQQALAQYDFANQQIVPDRLTRVNHAHYLHISERLLEIYRNGIGLTRQQLHQRAEAVFESCSDCPLRRIAAFIKLLDDASEFETDRKGEAAKLRIQVFQQAAIHHPLVDSVSGVFGSQHWEVKHKIARDMRMLWPELEGKLFSDVMEFHTLVSCDGFVTGHELLARYNVAQVQACLYRAVRMTIWAHTDLSSIVRLIKLTRLMHMIKRREDGCYQFILTGPASGLRATRRYGVAMARIIPGLLACRDWKMSAVISPASGQRVLSLQLTSRDGLSSTNPVADEFDSKVEADLLKKWNEVSLPNWKLARESELLVQGQTVFTPDFVATHDSGRQVHIEIMGYWTPEYLQAKLETLRRFSHHRILIVAQESARSVLNQLPRQIREKILWYKTRIPIDQFQAVLQQF